MIESFEPEDSGSNSEELSVKVGDLVNVLVKTPNGWWFVQHDDRHGWVPGTYLEPDPTQPTKPYVAQIVADIAVGTMFITRERFSILLIFLF